jgi:hypothetical protein
MIFNIFNYRNIYEIAHYRQEVENFKKEILSCKENSLIVVPEYNLCKHNSLVLSSSVLIDLQKVKIIYIKNPSELLYKLEILYQDSEGNLEIALKAEYRNMEQLVRSVNLFLFSSCNLTSLVL